LNRKSYARHASLVQEFLFNIENYLYEILVVHHLPSLKRHPGIEKLIPLGHRWKSASPGSFTHL